MTLAYRMKRRKTRRYAKDFYCDAPITRDPTFTFNLRRNYKSEVEFRWRKVRATVVDAVSRQDMLGTNMLKPSVGSMLSGGQDKIKLFQDWFDRLLAVAVLENDGNWLTPMVTAAYNRGIERAHVLSNSKALPPDRDTVIAALRQFAFVELQGIVEAVSQVAVRSVAEGLINERSKSAIVSGITDAVQKIGVVRSRAMVDTIIVKSFNVASLDQFAAAGLKNVGILSETIPAAKPLLHDAKKKKSIIQALIESVSEEVEVLTAGDDDVCPICEDISMDGPYFIDDAYDLIPAHPHCRCAFVPAEDRRFAPIERDAAHHDANQHSGPAALIRMVHLHKMVLVKARAATVRAADADFSRASMYVWKQGDVVIAGVRDEFDPNEERDPDGKWTTGGGSAAPEEAKSAQSPKAEAKSENERNLSKPLDKREEMALNGYSKNLSQDINKDLRGQDRTAKAIKNNPDAIVKDYTKAMDSAFDKASTAKDVTTFRAVSARTWEKMQASGEFKDNAFVSTTTSHRIADKFGKDELKGGHVVVNLDIPKGSKAIYMADKSNHAGEREVLLARGSTWKRGADRDGRPTFTLHSTIKDEWNEEDHPRVPAGQPGAGEFEGANSGGAEKPFSGAAIEKGAPASKEELKKQGLVTLMGRQQNLQKAINEEKDPDKRQALRQELLKNMEVQHQLYTEKGNPKRQAEYAYKIDKLKSNYKLSSDYDAKPPSPAAKAPEPVAAPKPPAAPEPFHQTKPSPPPEKFSAGPIGGLPPAHGSMSSSERQELKNYTGSSYKVINSQLRVGAMTEDQYRRAQLINRALDKLPPYRGEVTRQASVGSDVYQHYKPGMIVEERGFTSTSKKSNWQWSGGTKYVIKSQNGRSIAHLSNHPHEDEVLFKSGTRFKVVRVEGKTVHMEEVEHVR